MEEQKSNVGIRDILNYRVEEYITEEDRKIIRDIFKDNDTLLRVIRKVFMPTVSDANLPVEELSKDLWFAGVDFVSLSKDEVQARVIARAEAIKFVAGGIMSLKQIANIKEETEMEKAMRRQKDSTK